MLLEKKNGSTNKQFWSSLDAGTWRLRLVADSSTQDVQPSQNQPDSQHHQNQPDHYQQKNQQEQQPQQRSTSSSSTIFSNSHQTFQQQITTISSSISAISTSSSFLQRVVSSHQELPKVGVRSPRSTTLTLGWWTWTTFRWLDNFWEGSHKMENFQVDTFKVENFQGPEADQKGRIWNWISTFLLQFKK